MDDLISRAAALDAIDHERSVLIEEGRPGAEHVVVHHARRLIEELPSVDVELVIHCGECKHADEYCHCSLVNFWGTANDYCSRGVRR